MIKFIKIFLIFLFILTDFSFAQLYFFGRNKVQYEEFDWKVLKTDNFNIYYYGEMEEIAEIGASIAERTYEELKVELNHVITNKIPLIFYNTHTHFQQTNVARGFIPEGVGGFFEFIKGRVVIPYMGSLNDFRHVIRHELVHVFMTTKVYRILQDHRLPTDRLPPLWFVEGLAEFLSTDIDAQARMVMRDAVINGYFRDLENIYEIYGSFLMYKEGQNFLEFIKEKYGKEKVLLFIDNFWMYKNFTDVIAYTLGTTIKQLDSEWNYYVKKKYFPLLEDYAPMRHAAKPVTDFGYNFTPVYYEYEGEKYIYFNANRDGYSSLYRVKYNIDNEEIESPELILRGEKTEEFESFHLFNSSIDISDNGLISFVTKSGKTDAIHFYSIEEDEVIFSFKRDFLISISSPKFSDDGNKVVFNAVDQKGFSDIYIYNLNTEELERLTNDYYDDKDPVFGINENYIVFTSDRTAGEYEKKYNLFRINIVTLKIEYVTYINGNCYAPDISSNKNNLLFTSDVDGVRNIWQMKFKDGKYSLKIQKQTNFIGSAFNPRFINDSTITFTGFEDFSFNIYSKELEESVYDSTRVIVMDFNKRGPEWKADILKVASTKEAVKYENKYTLDYAQSRITTDPVFGTRGGAVLSVSDLFGDDNYYFLIYNTADVQSEFLKSFNIALQRVNLGDRTNFGYGVFHFSGRRYDIRESEEYFYERSFGGSFQMSFPLSTFQRIEAGLTVANSDKEIITGLIERKALLVSNTLAWVADNSLWGPTGPIDGHRARLLLGYTSDVKYSNVNYFSVMVDLRKYFRLGYRTAFAVRGALFYNEGKEARRYFMGGSWDLRGWRRWSIRGEKLWLSSLEFRFPLIDALQIKLPFIDLGFFQIRGAAFFDAGGAWDEKYRQTLGSVGAGVRFNLFGALVLRYDIGKKIENNFQQFQDGLFYQFFFGWDF